MQAKVHREASTESDESKTKIDNSSPGSKWNQKGELRYTRESKTFLRKDGVFVVRRLGYVRQSLQTQTRVELNYVTFNTDSDAPIYLELIEYIQGGQKNSVILNLDEMIKLFALLHREINICALPFPSFKDDPKPPLLGRLRIMSSQIRSTIDESNHDELNESIFGKFGKPNQKFGYKSIYQNMEAENYNEGSSNNDRRFSDSNNRRQYERGYRDRNYSYYNRNNYYQNEQYHNNNNDSSLKHKILIFLMFICFCCLILSFLLQDF